MSSIEQQLIQDIAAVTGGVVVTDSDLRIARGAIDERIDSRRHRSRRLAVIAAAAAAVLLLIGGLAAVQSMGGDAKTAPPANSNTSPSDPDAAFLTGSAPTDELVRGVWRLDNGGILMRFAAPDLVTWDDGGRLFEGPGVQGRYAIAGDQITITVDGGPAGCGGQELAMRASLPEPGIMHFVYTRPGTGACFTTPSERWAMERMLPTGIYGSYTVSGETGWGPLADKSLLHGSWFTEGSEYVIELAPNGNYHVATGSGEQVDYGDWSLQGSRLALTSRPDSVECTVSDQLVLGNVEYVEFGSTAIRSTVRRNDCGAPWADAVWILIPHNGR